MAPKRQKSAGSSQRGRDHPDDIAPLVLTSATQQLFGCRVDEDMTEENPYKLLRKEHIIQDMKARAAVSDFSPVKHMVLDYPEEELLLVFDRDFTYGQSFYLVLTPEAKNRRFSPPEPESPELMEREVDQTPEPEPWRSLGSEQEMDEESVEESREKLRLLFSRPRRKFGAPVCFSDLSAADAVKGDFLGCVSQPDSRFSLRKTQMDCRTQAAPPLQSSSSQTQWKSQKNNFTQYQYREMSEEEIESHLSSESLKNFCISVTPRMLHAPQQQEIMDVWLDGLKALGQAAEARDRCGKTSGSLLLHQFFTLPQCTEARRVSAMKWHPTLHGVLAVALTGSKWRQLEDSSTSNVRPFIVFYGLSDPFSPQLFLECPEDINAFDFCPSNPNIIAGGCVNGQIVLWDLSAHIEDVEGTRTSGEKVSEDSDALTELVAHEDQDNKHTQTQPVVCMSPKVVLNPPLQDLEDHKDGATPVVSYSATSAFTGSHRAPITDVQWLPATFQVTETGSPVENKHNISSQVVTCSPDCTLIFWDLRMSSLLNMPLADRKQTVPSSIQDSFRHLDRTFSPLFKVSLPKMDTGGEYAPLKFSLENYRSNNTEKPHYDMDKIEVVQDSNQLRAPSARTLVPLEDVNTKLYVGTEDGDIIYFDWKMVQDDSGAKYKRPSEVMERGGEVEDSGAKFSAKPFFCFNCHYWSVKTMARSPFYKDILLTTGGLTFALWKEDVMVGPVLVSPSSQQVYTASCWSPSRPAVFFVGREDGSVEVWDLLESSSQPAQVQAHITEGQITCISAWTAAKQHFLAVADNLGGIRVFEIPKFLYSPSRKESLTVRTYFEQETEVLKNFLRQAERWVEEKKKSEELKKKTERENPEKEILDQEEQHMKEYKDWLELEEEVLKGQQTHDTHLKLT